MAKKSKGNRVQVILECTEHKASGMPGTSRYITTKKLTKVIKMVKSPKTGAYTFVEKVMPGDDVDAWLKSK